MNANLIMAWCDAVSPRVVVVSRLVFSSLGARAAISFRSGPDVTPSKPSALFVNVLMERMARVGGGDSGPHIYSWWW